MRLQCLDGLSLSPEEWASLEQGGPLPASLRERALSGGLGRVEPRWAGFHDASVDDPVDDRHSDYLEITRLSAGPRVQAPAAGGAEPDSADRRFVEVGASGEDVLLLEILPGGADGGVWR